MKIMIIVFFVFVSCARSELINSKKMTEFYFTDRDGILYEYNQTEVRIVDQDANAVGELNKYQVHTTGKKKVNILNSNGSVLFSHHIGKQMAASVVSGDLLSVYYVTNKGELFSYDTEKGVSQSKGIRLYPVPKQMILDETNEYLFYHDKSQVYRLNLNDLSKEQMMNEFFPIQSIALNKDSNEIYVSKLTDGKIFKLDNRIPILIHNSMSARGSAICYREDSSSLIFSKSIGRGIQIQELNLKTGEVTAAITFFKSMLLIN